MVKIFIFLILLLAIVCRHNGRPVYTQVSFLYDIKRGELENWGKRTLEYYLSYFRQLLQTDLNLIVFGDSRLEEVVWTYREQHNTVFVRKELSSFKDYWFANLTEKARQGILQRPHFQQRSYPQYKLEYYNLLMFGKLYVMTEAVQYDKWNTDYLLWTDGGFMHQFSSSIVYPQNVLKKFYQLLQPQWVYLTYSSDLYFGFTERQLGYINRTIQYDENVLASTMGGTIHMLRDMKNAFEVLTRITLERGDINSDQSILTLTPVKYSFFIPTTTAIKFGNFYNKFHVHNDVGKIQVNPRYFYGRMGIEGKMMITASDTQELNHQQNISRNIDPSLEAIQRGFEAQSKVLKTFYQYKIQANKKIVQEKIIAIGLLLIGLSILFIQNIRTKMKIDKVPI